MKRVYLFSALLIVGMAGSQFLPALLQEICKVRGLVHFSAYTHGHGLWFLPENMNLTPLRQDFAVRLRSAGGSLTVLSNLGKMFPAFCYRNEASPKVRLGLAIGLWPRGEVGAGVLITSLGYGLGGTLITSAMLCLALNLLLTGVFVLLVRKLAEA